MKGEGELKKIIGLSIAIALIVALIGTGTWALFSDQETATDNTFTAGTLNLQVGAADPCTESIDIGGDNGMVPGDSGNAATWLTRNTGSIAGDLSISLSEITNNENEVKEPETGDGGEPGELGANLKVAFWMDGNKSGDWDHTSDYYLKSDQTKVAYTSGGPALPTEAYATLDSYNSDSWADVQTNVAGSTDFGNFRVEYDLPSATTDIVQSDSCVFTITFDLDQYVAP